MDDQGIALEGPHSVPAARRWAADVLHTLDRGDLVESTEIAVTELATNAVVHGSAPAGVRLAGTRRRPRFEVYDATPDVPAWPRHRAADLQPGGRGLELVARVCTAWGVELHADGKVMWCEPAPSPATRPAPFDVRRTV